MLKLLANQYKNQAMQRKGRKPLTLAERQEIELSQQLSVGQKLFAVSDKMGKGTTAGEHAEDHGQGDAQQSYGDILDAIAINNAGAQRRGGSPEFRKRE